MWKETQRASTPINVDLASASSTTSASPSSSRAEKTPISAAQAPPDSAPLPPHDPAEKQRMAVYELDPHHFLPAGHQIIDGGPIRLPRTFVTPAVRPARTHENFMVAEVVPPPAPSAMGAVRE